MSVSHGTDIPDLSYVLELRCQLEGITLVAHRVERLLLYSYRWLFCWVVVLLGVFVCVCICAVKLSSLSTNRVCL